jgi:alpha-amylase
MTQLFKNLLLLACFASFIHSAEAQMVQLHFRVDMRHETVSPNGVHVAGDFQAPAGLGGNWSPGLTALSDSDGDLVYEFTAQLPPGTYHYKFINGNDWSDKPELPPPDCAFDDGVGNFNRRVVVGSQGISLPVVKFDSCNALLRFAVNMQGKTVSTDGVHVMGDFQQAAGYASDWAPADIPLTDPNGDGTYEVELPVPPGTYHYLFVNGDQLVDTESPPTSCTVPDSTGRRVREISAASGLNNRIVRCYESCQICDPQFNTNYDTHWWNDAVFYEIFVRSFYDSDNDGIGDFQGIIEKLDYLNDGDPATSDDLGITGIWLMPMMESPSYHGYDVTDYYKTEPDYGTMADFEELLDSCHARGIRVIIDYVMNHSSSQHPWFVQSANSQNGYRDWYRWSPTHPGYNGPWGQPVWHARNGEFYYGLFWGGMPDLNYSHPPVKTEMFDIAKFWLNKGVDGFRLDAIKYLDEDGNILENTPETFQLLEDFNTLYKTENPDAFAVGEVWSNTASIIPYTQNNRLDACFDFDLAYSLIGAVQSEDPRSVYNQLQVIETAYPRLQYATFLTNHDIDRIYSQLGNDLSKMKLAASLYLTLPGVPFVYYGEEIGMIGTGIHENIRRPMQWTDGTHAGFSNSTPWYGLGSNYPTHNVADMQGNPASLLRHYQRLIHMRNQQPALRRGYLLPVQGSAQALLSFARVYEEEMVVVTANTGTQPIATSLSLLASSLPQGTYQVVELFSQADWGSLDIDRNGAFSSWRPGTAPLEGRDTWALLISKNPQVSLEASEAQPFRLSLFPNPATQQVSLRWEGKANALTRVELHDLQGRNVMQHASRGAQCQLDVSSLPAGMYFVAVSQEGDRQVKRLVVK